MSSISTSLSKAAFAQGSIKRSLTHSPTEMGGRELGPNAANHLKRPPRPEDLDAGARLLLPHCPTCPAHGEVQIPLTCFTEIGAT